MIKICWEDIISVVTVIACLYVCIAMSLWLYILRKNLTPIAWIFVSIIFAKAAILLWALGILFDINPIYGRILIMIAVFIQVAVTVVMYRRRQWKLRFWR